MGDRNQNVGRRDRILRVPLGVATVGLGYFLWANAGGRWIGAAVAALILVALVLFVSATTGTCGIYGLVGIDTCSDCTDNSPTETWG